jgi:hypothetical protein
VFLVSAEAQNEERHDALESSGVPETSAATRQVEAP